MPKTLQAERLKDAKLLVRVPNWVGDAVMCMPALRALRELLPQAELTLLARPWVRDIFPAEELHCELIAYDSRGAHKGAGRLRIISTVRERRFDAAILFQNAFDAALVSWLARIPVRAGYSRQGRAPLLTHAVRPPRRGEIPPHETHYYLEMLRRLGLISGYGAVEQISLPSAPTAREAARRHLLSRAPGIAPLASKDGSAESPEGMASAMPLPAGNDGIVAPEPGVWSSAAEAAVRPAASGTVEAVPLAGHPDRARGTSEVPGPSTLLVGVSPGASFGTAKRWPAPQFAELIGRLTIELGATCVLFGSVDERELAEEVIAASRTASLSLAGQTTLAEFMRLVCGCDLLVTNDTGTMHAAAALGVPTLALFGPTNEQETRPLGVRAEVVAGEAFCRPCKLRHCPIDHRCMKSLSVKTVFEHCRSLLDSPALPGSSATGPAAVRNTLSAVQECRT